MGALPAGPCGCRRKLFGICRMPGAGRSAAVHRRGESSGRGCRRPRAARAPRAVRRENNDVRGHPQCCRGRAGSNRRRARFRAGTALAAPARADVLNWAAGCGNRRQYDRFCPVRGRLGDTAQTGRWPVRSVSPRRRAPPWPRARRRPRAGASPAGAKPHRTRPGR